MSANWKFDDAADTACFTTTFVLQGASILRVYHDYDGDWQFHGSADQPADESVMKVVALEQVVKLDDSVESLHDLPYGWAAERSSPGSQWQRFKNTPFPSYSENGFYLEDAVWLSEYRDDISPPSEEECEGLDVGDIVKLIFRFADENADREDGQCERIWVEITGFDEDGYFIGTIENDPHHTAAEYGDVVSFHPLQIAEIYVDGE
jgi:hypothetical protein